MNEKQGFDFESFKAEVLIKIGSDKHINESNGSKMIG